MDAIVLAGGFGTRMRPLTHTRPKPLLPILNVPMIDHVVRWLPHEVDRVVLAVNYMADAIRDHLARSDLGKEVLVIEEDEPLGTGGAFRNALPEVTGEEFIGLNGDLLCSLDLQEMVDFHRERGGIGTIALWEVDDPSRYGVVELEGGDRITTFVEKPEPGTAPSNLINAGAYVLRTEILDLVEPGVFTSIEREVFPRVLDRGLHGFRFSGYWVDAGTPEAYLRVHRELLDRTGPVVGEGVVFHPSAQVDTTTLIGDGVVLGEARLGPYAALGEGCVVGEGASITDSVLFPGVTVGAGASISHSILGEDAEVGRGEALEGVVLEDGRRP